MISARIAKVLDWDLADNAFVDRLAARAGLEPEEVAELEERPTTFAERFARVASSFPDSLMSSVTSFDLEEERLARVTRELVEEIAREGRGVLVGRAAAAVLASAPDVLRVRVVAPFEARLATASERLGLSTDEAARQLHETDRNRERYHREFYGRDWADPTHYHLTLNTAALGYDGSVQAILGSVRAFGWSDSD